jgi:hypothetical protein
MLQQIDIDISIKTTSDRTSGNGNSDMQELEIEKHFKSHILHKSFLASPITMETPQAAWVTMIMERLQEVETEQIALKKENASLCERLNGTLTYPAGIFGPVRMVEHSVYFICTVFADHPDLDNVLSLTKRFAKFMDADMQYATIAMVPIEDVYMTKNDLPRPVVYMTGIVRHTLVERVISTLKRAWGDIKTAEELTYDLEPNVLTDDLLSEKRETHYSLPSNVIATDLTELLEHCFRAEPQAVTLERCNDSLAVRVAMAVRVGIDSIDQGLEEKMMAQTLLWKAADDIEIVGDKALREVYGMYERVVNER